MKKNVLFSKCMLFAIALCLSVVSCNKDNDDDANQQKGTLSMSLKAKGKKSNATPDALIITIEDENGAFFYENERVELLNMGENFITAPITIDVGNYSITYFTVVDSADNIIYASPMEGSDLAEFVYAPLPIEFEIIGGEVTNIAPEVIEVIDQTPEDFGYMGISFEVNELIRFIIKPLAYNPEINGYEIVPVIAYMLDENGDTVAYATIDENSYGKKANNGPFSRSISNLEDNRTQSNGEIETVNTGLEVKMSADIDPEESHEIIMSNPASGFSGSVVFTTTEAAQMSVSASSLKSILNIPIFGTNELIVINGYGSGDDYNMGREVLIAGTPPTVGMQFIEWVGDPGVINPTSLVTRFVISGPVATIRAAYGYEVNTINCIEGAGLYEPGDNLIITAVPSAGNSISHWLINGEVYESTNYSLLIPMQDRNMTIEAVYRVDCPSTLTVDGTNYNTIVIGDQCWMAENLRRGNPILSKPTNNGTFEKNNYDGSILYEGYGGLYPWGEAMNYSTTEGVQGICPNGWHIPTDGEWIELEMAMGMPESEANSIDMTSRGNTIVDDLLPGGSSGFEATLGGLRAYAMGTYSSLDSDGYYWTSTVNENGYPYIRMISGQGTPFGVLRIADYQSLNDRGYSVRCVKD